MSNSTSKELDGFDIGVRVFVGLIIVIFFIVIIIGSFYTIQSGQEGVLLTFNKAGMTAITPGLHFKVPIIQKIIKFDVRTQKYGVDASQSTLESASSSDLQVVKIQVALNYHLSAGKTPEIFSNLGNAYESTVISPTIHEVVKSVTAQFTAQDLIQQRELVRSKMETLLRDKLVPYNINVEQMSIVSFDFSEQFNNAIESKVTAVQKKEQAENDLARIKVEAEQKIAVAEGEKGSQIAIAEGNAQAIKLNAEAEAQKIALIQQQLSSSPQYIELQKVQKWSGNLPTLLMTGGSDGQQTILDVSSIVKK